MSSVGLYNSDGKKVKDVSVPEALTQGPIRKGLLYYVVNYQQAKKRAGTHETRTRGDVRGSTKKIYRQKGTGRARHGDRKAPLFVGGGTIFGPHARDYSQKLPKSARRRGLQTAVALKNKEGNILLIEKPDWKEPKTKVAIDYFKKLDLTSALLVLEHADPVMEKSVRNLRGFKILPVEGLNVYDILNFEKLILTENALAKLSQRVHLAH